MADTVRVVSREAEPDAADVLVGTALNHDAEFVEH
jgi:hypothetical protein